MHFGVTELLLILVIVVLIFGTKKIKNIGGDLGGAIKSFRKAMHEGEHGDEASQDEEKLEKHDQGRVIEGEVTSKSDDKKTSAS